MDAASRLAKALSLPTTGQDWGIENADPSRLSEFIKFAKARIPEHPFELEILAELIFQSAEEAHESGSLSDELELELLSFISLRHQMFPLNCDHWVQLPEAEWYVPTAIRRALAEA